MCGKGGALIRNIGRDKVCPSVLSSKPSAVDVRAVAHSYTFLHFRAARRIDIQGNSLLAFGKGDRKGDEVNHAPREKRCREENGKCGRRSLGGDGGTREEKGGSRRWDEKGEKKE